MQTLKHSVVVRLNRELYLKLEQKFSRFTVNEQATALQAGYALGVEAVLKELRNGYTVEQADV